MSDYHHQLPATELDPVFQFARDTWTNSFDRFSGDPGDIDAFNRDTGNDIFIIQHQLGESFNGHTLDQNIPYFVYLWKQGIRKKLIKDFEKRITVPIHQITMLSTPAQAEYPFHYEGMEYTQYASDHFREEVYRSRRSVNLNYPVSNADLTNSRVEWAKPTDKLHNMLVSGYSKILTHSDQNTDQAYIKSHIKMNNLRPENTEGLEESKRVLSAMHDSGEGVRIKSHQAMVYEDDADKLSELLTPVDEYWGMDKPTLIRTNEWHRVDNTRNTEQRTMGVISFPPEITFQELKTKMLNNEFLK